MPLLNGLDAALRISKQAFNIKSHLPQRCEMTQLWLPLLELGPVGFVLENTRPDRQLLGLNAIHSVLRASPILAPEAKR